MSEPTSNLRVLVVDDEPMTGGAFRRTLASGYEVVTVTSAEEGIAKLEQSQFCAVVSDTNLGSGMWGPEFLAQVAERWPGMGRVIMSGFDSETAARALRSGVAHMFLRKPWNMDEPGMAITQAMDKAASERRPA